MPITHKFASQKADGADATLVRPSNWNDGHGGTVDVLSLSVYSVSGNFTVQVGVTGNCVMFLAVTGSNTLIAQLPLLSQARASGVGINQGVAQRFTFLRTDANPGLAKIVPQDVGALINGDSEYRLVNQYQLVVLMPDPVLPQWWVVGVN